MAAVTEQVALESAEAVEVRIEVPAYDLFARVRKFLWLSSGLFSAASFAIPFVGFMAYGTSQPASTNFLAAVVSACLFGIASLLHFGPDTA
jgi:hypothetical protein